MKVSAAKLVEAIIDWEQRNQRRVSESLDQYHALLEGICESPQPTDAHARRECMLSKSMMQRGLRMPRYCAGCKYYIHRLVIKWLTGNMKEETLIRFLYYPTDKELRNAIPTRLWWLFRTYKLFTETLRETVEMKRRGVDEIRYRIQVEGETLERPTQTEDICLDDWF